MDIPKTIKVLEALASGYSPTTGEKIINDSVLNERDVIRAFQIAIDQLQTKTLSEFTKVAINENDIKDAIRLFEEHQMSPTYSRLVGLFLATRKFKNEAITSNELYGKYEGLYQRGQLMDFLNAYLSDNGYSKHGRRIDELHKDNPSEEIDFFQKETFNNLPEGAINELKEKIDKLGIIKNDDLPDYVQKARINYPRAYEPWTDIEEGLLHDMLQYTNDLELLSECFQRGKGAIASKGQELIYQYQNGNWNKAT
ncbi:hypothetical protein [Pedobacter montanisoli]|uniref:Uncharacterized protein n=1 Tax=Pedobacter montanisoli TaxID=2923277 RepID=A0ABS9ZYT0_9SPHI|nr:hypothetical protein [Pedobacter montanisoli]MCJ0743461.1 hypothetical protein [Pedobacter montanisoli]